MVKLKMFN